MHKINRSYDGFQVIWVNSPRVLTDLFKMRDKSGIPQKVSKK